MVAEPYSARMDHIDHHGVRRYICREGYRGVDDGRARREHRAVCEGVGEEVRVTVGDAELRIRYVGCGYEVARAVRR